MDKDIPKDLDACIERLKKMISEEEIAEIKEMTEDDFVGATHHGLGTSLRNGWGLWTGSELAQYFGRMGLWHADDISGLILRSFHRHLKGKPLDVEGQVAQYRAFWEKNKERGI